MPWPYVAFVTAHDGKPLCTLKCSTPDSLLTSMRPYLETPGVTAVITTANETETADVRA